MEYKGYTINIHQDDSPENPFDSWDTEPLLIVYTSGPNDHYEDGTKYNGAPHPPALTRDECKRHWQYVTDTDYTSVKDFMQSEGVPNLEQLVNEYVDDLYRHGDSYREELDVLERVYTAKGIKVHRTTSTGHSQSCWADLLVVATPEWCEKVGHKPDGVTDKTLEATADLYGHWAWGDVYGYTVTKANTEHEEDEVLDSCWGFYGDDHEKSGLMESAKNVIDTL